MDSLPNNTRILFQIPLGEEWRTILSLAGDRAPEGQLKTMRAHYKTWRIIREEICSAVIASNYAPD